MNSSCCMNMQCSASASPPWLIPRRIQVATSLAYSGTLRRMR
uniref:Uncharacterized protein n=1 Tax=Arundo donax TaxID=35708 RepID=A0A0A9AQR2_ARUDO